MSVTTCPHCTKAATTGRCITYQIHCVGCCARLVMSARPLRTVQEGHLAAIGRHDNAPTREQILQHIRSNQHVPT